MQRGPRMRHHQSSLHTAARSLSIFLGVLSGCVSGTETIDPVPTLGSGGSGGGASGLVAGAFIDRRYHSTVSVTETRRDLSAVSIRALVDQGGSWVTYPGTGHADGTFEIPDVPEGPYWLALDQVDADLGAGIDSVYRYTTSRAPMLRANRCGRGDAVEASEGTKIEWTLSGLAPWSEGDEVWWSTSDLRFGGVWGGYNLPSEGETSTWGTAGWSGDLAKSTKHDVVEFSQVRDRVGPGGLAYETIERFGSVAGFTMADGTSTHLDVELSPMASASLPFDLRLADFRAALGAPDASIMVFLSAVAPGSSCDGVRLMYFNSLGQKEPVGDAIDLGVVTYGDPALPGWRKQLYVSAHEAITVTAPGAIKPVPIGSSVTVVGLPEALGSASIVPSIHPVLDLRVNGGDAYSPSSGAGLTPTLTWDPPAVGQPAGYLLEPLRVYAGGEYSNIEIATRLITAETTLTIPPGVLLPGEAYVFRVTAFSADVEPFLEGWPTEWASTASTVTALILP